jgi:membrane-associated phospholipid phosphatase
VVDNFVPLIPLTILIYLSQMLMLPLSMFLAHSNLQRARAFAAMLMAIGFSATVFLFFPTRLPRNLSAIETTDLSYLWQMLYALDTDSNCLPSLHVSLAFLAVWSASRSKPFIRVAMLLWALAISASTLTTKQHLFVDVISGFFVACAVAAIAILLISERDSR